MTAACSIIVPVHNRAGVTKRCLDALLATLPGGVGVEVIVVDDASSDETEIVLARYERRIEVLRHAENQGFARSCNDGAALANGDFLVFLNNDTVPLSGWLERLREYADEHRAAGAVGSKLLFPNDMVQHAGVVICRDYRPRHLYAGFPSGHPAVNKSRRVQAVTAASMLVPREAFERAGGFDIAYRNCLEDADLCLRLGALGYEVHYCHESVLYHLESVTRGRRGKDIERNAKLFLTRWKGRVRTDELDYYVEDGLLRFAYEETHPWRLEVAPELAVLERATPAGDDGELAVRLAREVSALLRETARLTAEIAERDLGATAAAGRQAEAKRTSPGATPQRVLRRVREIERELAALQADLERETSFPRSEYLAYRGLTHDLQEAVHAITPRGATIVVVTRGDDELLDLDGRVGWHFPQVNGGTYAGHYPATDDDAIAHLENLRERGADYFVIPESGVWWLEAYPRFAEHLRERYGEAGNGRVRGLIYELRAAPITSTSAGEPSRTEDGE